MERERIIFIMSFYREVDIIEFTGNCLLMRQLDERKND